MLHWFNERKHFTLHIALLANTPAQVESLLHSLEPTACVIGLHVNADLTEYMCFNQRGDISTLKGGALKLVDKFSTSEAASHQPRMTDLTDKIKRIFFQAVVVSIQLYGCTTWMLIKHGEKAWRQLHKNAVSCIEQVPEATPHKTSAVQQPTTHHKNYQSLMNQTCITPLEK